MKKYLLLLFIASISFGQNVKLAKPSSVVPITPKQIFNESNVQDPASINPNNSFNSKTSSINLFTGSMNVYGYVSSHSRPLQYNPGVNAVSMFARKNGTYTASSNNNSGVIIGLYSTNMGATWNETCLWTNSTYFAHYPNGGIYNPIGNTNINNAYLVGAGPLNSGTGWIGNWYASKQITTPGNNTPGADQQAMINSSLPAGMSKHHFSHSSFTAIDGGKVRSLGIVANDPDATTKAAFGMRGAALLKGTFAAGAFVWSIDTFIPKTTTVSVAAGGPYNNLSNTPLQAWDENGMVGYIVLIGSRATETISPSYVNQRGGMQPIIYKTSNGGASWALLPANDFADPWCDMGVYDRTYPIATNTNIIIANFSASEGWDVAVDANGQLHIATMLYGHASNHTDSLDYRYSFGSQQYSYGESGPFYYPVIYDFYTIPTFGFCYHMVDSLGTEGPSGILGQPGYTTNLWVDGTSGKLDQDARIQMSRSADGTKIFYTWTETDTTVAGLKWNIRPNLKFKGFDVNMKKVTPRYDLTASDVTQAGTAYYHYVSNKAAGSSGTYTIPCTTSKNSTHDGSLNVDTYFINNAIVPSSAFSITAFSPILNPFGCCGSPINVQNISNEDAFDISSFPNPTNTTITITIRLKEVSDFEVRLLNSFVQLMDTYKMKGQLGINEVNIDMSNFRSGIYFYTVKVGNRVITKKLVVQ